MFATVEELSARLRYDVDVAAGSDALAFASDEVRAVCSGVSLDRHVNDTVMVYGTVGALLELPGRPVESVTQVTRAGVPLPGWRLRGDRLYRTQGWSGPHEVYDVVYTHGFATPPPAVVAVTLARAARMIVNPEQVMQKRRGDYSASFGSSTTEVTGLSSWEMRYLALAGLRVTAEVW